MLTTTALESLDRAEQARVLVNAEGLCRTTESTGAVHIHPALKVENDARKLFARLWSDMGFKSVRGIDHTEVSRRPGKSSALRRHEDAKSG